MSRRRAKRTGMQKIKGTKKARSKDLETFRHQLISGGEVDELLSLYHQRHVQPLIDALLYHLEPWYKRLWWWTKDQAKRAWSKIRKEKTDESV